MKLTIPKKTFQFSARINQAFLMPARYIAVLLGLSMLTGLLTGITGTLFHISVDSVFHWRNELIQQFNQQPVLHWLIPSLSTALMLYLALFIVRRFAPEAAGSGIQEIEGALEGSRENFWHRLLPVKFIAGVLTIGSGMVMGREGPTIHMGGSLGHMVSKVFKTNNDNKNTLITAGAAAGLSAAFNTPLAAILFAIEEMRAQFKYGTYSVQAVALAVFIAAVVVRLYTGQVPAINMSHFAAPPLTSLPLFFILGLVFGTLGILFNRALIIGLDLLSNTQSDINTLLTLLIGAVIGYLGSLWPHATGSGDLTLLWAMEHTGSISLLILLFFVRIATTLLSYSSGAPGGIFAPMLALGTLLGLWYGHYVNIYFPTLDLQPGLFAIAGMGALFAATVRAPLTGIALSIELTNNYSLILPLILTVATATVTAELLGGKPIYSLLLERTLKREHKS
ncbi:MAG: H(+)/Cl(-) exchange transporter ClcA [Gammaproteobacteria bacterium]|jgi:chloride channel protein, CIC family|nr:H(+)/Cl(-) exchange transporter ClcA [Gammaproteobacteria bacterium]MBT5826908.1 H(+)/Cl(-) exchange transporter ClcA [Gammaproteobacteria bacterium]MBT5966807.1 H(+)/Cl(-) exchange transporter ClcA [Gammaproteobacteria bacterium]MBT6418978.1 H(+)/Cl(-) exchange transporter ClcA [Gammaproteobacteria bacterium]MBT6574992.1 H(+)/Cl(-) exchange transporter ClcA [Gammaproteobacteria bacterium]